MAHGLVIYRGDGAVEIDTSTISFNVVDTFTALKSVSTQRSYPALADFTLYVSASPNGLFPADSIPVPHTVSVVGQTVTASGGNIDMTISVLAK